MFHGLHRVAPHEGLCKSDCIVGNHHREKLKRGRHGYESSVGHCTQ
jgi:hypothetical protein